MLFGGHSLFDYTY